MAFLPEFEEDVFISYAHLDNDPLSEGQKGWIDHFHRALEVVLRQKLGKDPEIWRDAGELRGNEYFADRLVNVLPKVAVLISVLSPGYLNSEWCCKEMQEFCSWAERKGNLRFADKARIFKVLRTYLPPEVHPAPVRSLLGYEFYEMDVTTNRPQEFDPELGEKRAQRFFERVGDLAYDIVQLLQMLRASGGSAASFEHDTTVYLAETTVDQRNVHDLLRRELMQRGYRILPDKPLPVTGPELIQATDKYLEESRFSVHLVGERYGWVPELEESRSMACLQHEAALRRHHADPTFIPLVWMPPNLRAAEERQQHFIDFLLSDQEVHDAGDVIQGSIDEFKTYLEDKFRSIRNARKSPVQISTRRTSPRVYVMYDGEDSEDVRALINYLFENGFETIEPLREGDPAQVREDHRGNLAVCDAALVYWGKAPESWLRAKLRDLQKAQGYGRTAELTSKAIHIAAPESSAKRNFRTHEAEVIRHFAPFDPAALASFVSQLKTVPAATTA